MTVKFKLHDAPIVQIKINFDKFNKDKCLRKAQIEYRDEWLNGIQYDVEILNEKDISIDQLGDIFIEEYIIDSKYHYIFQVFGVNTYCNGIEELEIAFADFLTWCNLIEDAKELEIITVL